jgi:hypothetical protein
MCGVVLSNHNSGNNIERGESTTFPRSSPNHHGTSLHYVNRCVEVENNETPFDYHSLMYTFKKCEKPIGHTYHT